MAPIILTDKQRSRFLARIKPRGECLVWTGCVNPAGYGFLSINNRPVLAHRVAWALTFGPIPPGLCVLHRCDNPPCVGATIDHLFLGDRQANTLDAVAKRRLWQQRRETCPKGHHYAGANLGLQHSGRGRFCKACRSLSDHARYLRKKGTTCA